MESTLDRPDQVGLSHLGLSVANLERILPLIAPEETRQYFTLVSAPGRSALDSLAQGEFGTGRSTK